MDANSAPTENYVDRHNRLCRDLAEGRICDPELWLFKLLLGNLPMELACTPWLYEVSWWGGAFDLLFTDGAGTWCAVEVKEAPALYDSGSTRDNRRTKYRERKNKLKKQTNRAWSTIMGRFPHQRVGALGLWLLESRWTVHHAVDIAPSNALAA
jgi:hypothetical protein